MVWERSRTMKTSILRSPFPYRTTHIFTATLKPDWALTPLRRTVARRGAGSCGGPLQLLNDDIDLAAAIAAAMQDAHLHPGITLSVSNGIVTLEGEVDHPQQSETGLSLVRRFPGVAAVINEVRVATSRKRQESDADLPASE